MSEQEEKIFISEVVSKIKACNESCKQHNMPLIELSPQVIKAAIESKIEWHNSDKSRTPSTITSHTLSAWFRDNLSQLKEYNQELADFVDNNPGFVIKKEFNTYLALFLLHPS
jgi:hypothetical protein